MIKSFHHLEYDAATLAEAKGGARISVCIPALDEEETIGGIVEALNRCLVLEVPLVDEVIVIDDHSRDRTAQAAEAAGAKVVRASEVLSDVVPGPGKGQALWKTLYASHGDLIAWCDGDIRDFDARMIVGLLGPLIADEAIGFVKGYYRRPVGDEPAGGGRVTELVARPLINLLFPHLSSLVQPLAGEYAGRREVLEQVRFATGYGVELGLLVDLTARFGTSLMAQVDLGERVHRNRPLVELGPQAATILHTALRRADPDLVRCQASLLRPGAEPALLDTLDCPPICEIPAYRRRSA